MDSDERKRAPPDADFASEFAERIENEPADERVYRVALGLTGPTRVAKVASRADCSKNAARRHLKRLADIGVLTHVSEQPDTFERNESYFEWRRLNRLSDLSDEEYTERLGELLTEDEAYREEYDIDDPDALNPLDYGEYGDAEQVWLDLTNWRAIRQEIRDLRRVRHEDAAGAGLA